MKHSLLFCLLFFSFLLPAFAGSVDEKVKTADSVYARRDYATAIRLYEEALRSPLSAEREAAVQNNIGCCYFQTKDYGMAVLSFRRALRKESGHAEALHNLRLVESRLEDKFDVSSSVWEGMKEALAESGMLRAAGKWAFWLLLLAVLAAGVRFFSLPEKIRKVSSVVSLLLVLFALMAEGLTFLSPSSSEAENEWVVITETESHAAPSATSPVQRKLHPGTVVKKVQDYPSSWMSVTLPDGSATYLSTAALKQI